MHGALMVCQKKTAFYLTMNGVTFELPAMDLVLYQPKELLGEQVYARFGAEFPIRFDFLDTMEGQKLVFTSTSINGIY